MFRLVMLSGVICWLFVVGIVGAGSGDNLCHSTMAGQCHSDIEWRIGYFWAHNEPSVESCATYHYTFGDSIGDIWGMCNEYGMPEPDTTTSYSPPQESSDDDDETSANSNGVVLNTSYGSGSCNLPPAGVDDDFSYDTSSCQTSF